jgi:hypothetical protein
MAWLCSSSFAEWQLRDACPTGTHVSQKHIERRTRMLLVSRPLHFQVVVMMFASLTSGPGQAVRLDEYDGHQYGCVLEGRQCMRDTGGQIDKIAGMKDSVAFIHFDVDFTFDALHRYGAVNRVHRHPFASRKNDPHDFEARLLEQRGGRSLLKHVAER